MAVYNFPTQYLRFKFGSQTVKYYIPTAKKHISTYTPLDLENLGTKALNEYVSGVASLIPITSHGIYRPYNLYSVDQVGCRNVEFDSNFSNYYNWDFYDYSDVYSLVGLTIDRQFINVVCDMLNMWSLVVDTAEKTLTGKLLDADENEVCNMKVTAQWVADSPNVKVYRQSALPPFAYNEPVENTIYRLRVFLYPNTDDYPNHGSAGTYIYNDDKSNIFNITFAGIEYADKLYVPESRKSRFIETNKSKLLNILGLMYEHGSGLYVYRADINGPSTNQAFYSDKVKNALQFTGSPYEGNGNSEQTPTSGSYDGTTDSVDIDSLPSDSVLSSGLLKAYLPDETVLTNLHSYLFSSGFVDNIIKALKCPFDTIVKLHSLPLSLSGYSDTIKLGNLDSSIACDRTTSRFVDVDLGNIQIEGYYGLFNDYTTKYDIYLPYLNVISLPADEVVGATLSVTYRVDIMSGDFVAYIFSNKVNAKGYSYKAIIYSGAGNMASDIPITQSNTMGLIGALNNGLTAVPSKGQAPDLLGSFSAGVAIGVGGSISYGVKGGLSSNSGRLAKLIPYIRECVSNVVLPTNFDKLMGFRSEITDVIGNFSGFCKFRSFKLDFGTYDERGAIEAQLQAGVYIESGAAITTTHDLVLINNTSDDRTIGKTKNVVISIDGDYRDFVPLNELTLDIDISGTTLSSFNYIYIKDLDRYYFIREKTMINETICRVVLTCDLLESFASSIKSITAICERAESGIYTNPMLPDESVPVQVNNIIKYHNFSSGLTSNSMILIVI